MMKAKEYRKEIEFLKEKGILLAGSDALKLLTETGWADVHELLQDYAKQEVKRALEMKKAELLKLVDKLKIQR